MGWKHAVATRLFSRQFVQAVKTEAQVQAARLRALAPSNHEDSKLILMVHVSEECTALVFEYP